MIVNDLRGKSVNEIMVILFRKILKYGSVAMSGMFIAYASLSEQYDLSSSKIVEIKGDGVSIEITRKDIEEYLNESNRKASLDMADLIIHEEFYKDIDISSKEDSDRLSEFVSDYIDSNYGSLEKYNSYKAVYNISEDYITRCMAIDVKQEKKLKSLENEIDIDNVSLDAEWETNSDMYKYITADLAIFESAKEADEFYEKCKNGDIDFSSLDESRVQLGFGEKIYLNDNRLSDSLENKIKEDVVKCYTVEGYSVVLIVGKRVVSKKSLLKDIEDNLKKIKAQEILQLEFDEFRDSLDIKIETEEVKIKEW